ncbi:5'-nucleotidase C-terminal domain-containing protein [Pukyongiella litopenaei]|nr:5'-nucleotidase C-terminal domain-containing protein [Pukyongiella litopenaei]
MSAGTNLRLLATTDLHMHLTGHDYLADQADPARGLTRIATRIAEARAEAARAGAPVLLLDNGDALQGTPLDEIDEPGRPHPLMRALGYLRYDAAGLGNHDFYRGLAVLDRILADAPCPVLCSNLRLNDDAPGGSIRSCAVLDRDLPLNGRPTPLRIGLLSFLPPQTLQWEAHQLEGRVEIDGIAASARAWLPRMRDEGCDLVIALAHTGLAGAGGRPDGENAALALAELGGFDAIIAGHTHQRLPGPDHDGLPGVDAETGQVHGTPMVMPGFNGSDLGVIDLSLHRAGNRWQVAGSRCALRPAAGRPEDPGLLTLLGADHGATRARLRQHVGHSDTDLHSYFTFLAPDPALALVAAAQAAALRPCLEGTPLAGLPLVSVASPGRCGGRSGPGNYTDIPAGSLTRRHLNQLQIYPNQLCAVELNGAQLVDWLEMSASHFNRIEPGSTGSRLRNPSLNGTGFDVLHGLTCVIDLSAPARFAPDGSPRDHGHGRVTGIACNGRPVRPDDRFVVALNSFRANGGGNVRALCDSPRIRLPHLGIREALASYVSRDLPRDPIENGPPPWRFAPMPGTSVLARTGPGATAHMGDLDGRGVEITGQDTDGFLLLSVPL